MPVRAIEARSCVATPSSFSRRRSATRRRSPPVGVGRHGRETRILLARLRKLADGEGFEPSLPCGKHAFQACPINHSGTRPREAEIVGRGRRALKPEGGPPFQRALRQGRRSPARKGRARRARRGVPPPRPHHFARASSSSQSTISFRFTRNHGSIKVR